MAQLEQPNVVGNFLSNYYTAQQKQQADQDRMRTMQRQDVQDRQAQQEHDWADLNRKNEIIARTAMSLTTPEAWDQAVPKVMQQLGLQGPPPSFAERENIINQAMSVKEQLAQKLEAQKFALDERQTNAQINASNAQAEAARALASQRAGGGGGPPLTNTDKREIYDTDELVGANKSAVSLLRQALDLSNRSYQGPGAQTVASGLSIFGAPMAENTIEFDNLLKQNVLPQLKAIFGGMPTEGERKVLLDLQGSSSLQRSVRNKIIATALRLAEARLRFNQDKAKQLRSGTYYNQAPDFSIEAAPAAQQQPRATATTPAQPQDGAVTWQFDANGNLVPGK